MEDWVILEVQDGVTVLAGEIDSKWVNEDRSAEEIVGIFATSEAYLLGAEIVERIFERLNDRGPDQSLLSWIDELVNGFTTTVEALIQSGGPIMEGNFTILNLLDVDLNSIECTDEVLGVVRTIDYQSVGSGCRRISDAHIDGAGEGDDLGAGDLKNSWEILRGCGEDDVHADIDIGEEIISHAEGSWTLSCYDGGGIIDYGLKGVFTLDVRWTS